LVGRCTTPRETCYASFRSFVGQLKGEFTQATNKSHKPFWQRQRRVFPKNNVTTTSYLRATYLKRCVVVFWIRRYLRWLSSAIWSRVMADHNFKRPRSWLSQALKGGWAELQCQQVGCQRLVFEERKIFAWKLQKKVCAHGGNEVRMCRWHEI